MSCDSYSACLQDDRSVDEVSQFAPVREEDLDEIFVITQVVRGKVIIKPITVRTK